MIKTCKVIVKKAILSIIKYLFNHKNKHLYNIYKGQRCFIIGNGPSINQQDLTLLSEEYTFVTNRFILHKDFERINPNFYCISDGHFIRFDEGLDTINNIRKRQQLLPNLSLFVSLRFYLNRQFRKYKFKNIYYILFRDDLKIWESDYFQTDITKGVNWGHTIIIDMCLPLAFYMGFNEVYLLGCDMNYSGVSNNTHFYGSTPKVGVSAGNISRNRWYDHVRTSYGIVKRHFKNDNRTIFDATKEGKLNIFQHVDLEDIVKNVIEPSI